MMDWQRSKPTKAYLKEHYPATAIVEKAKDGGFYVWDSEEDRDRNF